MALSERIEPLVLGLSSGDAIWNGYGMRVYDLDSAWSLRLARGGSIFLHLESAFELCVSNRQMATLNVKLLGEPGDEVLLGLTSVRLDGRPQVF